MRSNTIIFFTLLNIFNISNTTLAVEIDELEEITMQLVDPASIPKLKIQQHITIPPPAPPINIHIDNKPRTSIPPEAAAIMKPRETSKKTQQ